MSTAIIYIRVSTNEQAQRGYSQRSQQEKLNKYCKNNNIEIVRTVFEDHSAKNFNRPAWNAMMKSLNSNKCSRPKLILFTRWDRFSRNTANAYYVITQLAKLGIEPRAIDQPLDMSVPENKVLLAMYIVTAEVENDRRSLNIKQGIYKAKREGRWMGHAPIGYINISLPDGRKTIVPHEPEATLIRKAFQLIQDTSSMRLLYRTSHERGLRCSLNAFFNMLQNPVYCGKIRIRSVDNKIRQEVPGLHRPLVSEELFNLAQSSIKHRNNKYVKQQMNGMLILRGILYCPICSKKLSGSGSKGRSKKYFYYHCSYPCHYRIRADYVNEHVLNRIGTLRPNKKYLRLFERLIENAYNYLHNEKSIDKTDINKALHKLMERVANTRELLVKGIINEEDYLSIKSDCEQRIDSLGEQLNDSYRFNLQKKQGLKKLTAYFSDPALLFHEATTLLQIKTATLFLKEKSIYSKNKSDDMLKYEMKTICGHQYLNEQYQPKQSEFPDNLTKEQNDWIEEITMIEKESGGYILPQNALKVLNFLSDWVNICISIKIQETSYWKSTD